MLRVIAIALLASFGLPESCAGKATKDDEPVEPSPSAQCNTYATTWCSKAFGCYVQVGRIDESARQSNVDQCIQIISDKLPCAGVTSTTDDYDRCISQIKGMACSKWNVPQTQFGSVAPPAACDTALSFSD